MNVEFYADIDKDIPNEVIQNVVSYMSNALHSDIRCFMDKENRRVVYRIMPSFTCYPFTTAEDEEEIPF